MKDKNFIFIYENEKETFLYIIFQKYNISKNKYFMNQTARKYINLHDLKQTIPNI